MPQETCAKSAGWYRAARSQGRGAKRRNDSRLETSPHAGSRAARQSASRSPVRARSRSQRSAVNASAYEASAKPRDGAYGNTESGGCGPAPTGAGPRAGGCAAARMEDRSAGQPDLCAQRNDRRNQTRDEAEGVQASRARHSHRGWRIARTEARSFAGAPGRARLSARATGVPSPHRPRHPPLPRPLPSRSWRARARAPGAKLDV